MRVVVPITWQRMWFLPYTNSASNLSVARHIEELTVGYVVGRSTLCESKELNVGARLGKLSATHCL